MMGLLEKGDAVAEGLMLLPPEEEPELPPIAVNSEDDNVATIPENDLAAADDGPIDLAAPLTTETAAEPEIAEAEQPAESKAKTKKLSLKPHRQKLFPHQKLPKQNRKQQPRLKISMMLSMRFSVPNPSRKSDLSLRQAITRSLSSLLPFVLKKRT